MWTGFEDKWSPNPLPESERAMPAPINFTRKPTTNGKTAHAAAAATAR